MWQEHHHAADSAEDAIDEQRAQIAIRHMGLDEITERALARFDPAHRNLRERKNRPEHGEKNHRHPDPSTDRMQQQRVDSIRLGLLVRVRAAGGEFAKTGDEGASAGFRIGGVRDPGDLGGERVGESQRLFQLDDSLFRVRLHRHDRDAEFFRQFRGIEAQSGFFRDVHHVQGEDGGQAELDDLEDKLEVAFEIRGIHHADDHVRLRLSG